MRRSVKAALSAIEIIFSDTSVTRETTLEELQEIQSELDSKIDALKSDLGKF